MSDYVADIVGSHRSFKVIESHLDFSKPEKVRE